jgi:hypothetical protein
MMLAEQTLVDKQSHATRNERLCMLVKGMLVFRAKREKQ